MTQARRDAAAREAILDSLRGKLKEGDKQLIGNAGYRRFLAAPHAGHFEIDPQRVAQDARFDGLHVLRTNTTRFSPCCCARDLDERLAASAVTAEWVDIVRDLDRVEQVTVEQGSKRFPPRPRAPGGAGSLFQAVGVALPPLLRQLPNATSPPVAKSLPQPSKRRGRPRRGATAP